MTIHKSETHKYRIMQTSYRDESSYFTVEKAERFKLIDIWIFKSNHHTKELAMARIEKEIKKDNKDYATRKTKEEYL